MAEGSANTVDTLEIEIRSRADSAAREVEALATSISNFGSNVSRYIGDMTSFADVLERIASAAQKMAGISNLKNILRETEKSAARNAAREAKATSAARTSAGSAERQVRNEAAEAERIRREENAMWRDQERRERDADKAYRSEHRLNWKTVEQSVRAERARNTAPDNTAKEIAEWNRKQDELDDARLAERIKAEMAEQSRVKNPGYMQFNPKTGEYTRQVEKPSTKWIDDNPKAAEERPAPKEDFIKDDFAAKFREASLAARETEESARGIPNALSEAGNAARDASGTVREMADSGLKEAGEAAQDTASSIRDIAASASEAAGNTSALEGAAQAAKDQFGEADSDVEMLKDSIEFLESRIADYKHMLAEAQSAPNPNLSDIEYFENQIASLEKGLETSKAMLADYESPVTPAGGEAETSGIEAQTEAVRELGDETERARAEAEALNAEQNSNTTPSTSGQQAEVRDLAREYNNLGEAIREANEAQEETVARGMTINSVLRGIGKTIKNSLVGQLMRVAKMRFLRGIVKSIAKGFSEGINNMYEWSSRINGSFANSMDTAASKLMLMKNSIATAVAPAIEALIPVLSTVVSWIQTACNAISQFFALLNGQDTWVMAHETSEKWADSTKKGAKATKDADKAAKDLLADWDELNVIQQETNSGSSGGGGGGSGKKQPDYSKMFKISDEFDEWTKDFELIKEIVMTIGAGIAGWFVASHVQTFLKDIGLAGDKVDGVFSKIKKGIVGAVLLTVGYSLAESAGEEYAENGFTWQTFAKSIIGAGAAAIGGVMIASAFGINPAIGAALGVAVTIVATIIGYTKAKNQNAEKYIRDLLKTQVYGFDVQARVESITVTAESAQKARQDVDDQVSRILQTANTIRNEISLGLDVSNSFSTMYSQITAPDTGLLALIGKELEADKNVVTMYYKFVQKGSDGTTPGAEGNEGYENAEGFKIDNQAITYLEGWYRQQGENFAKCFVDGETGKIKEGMGEVALAIAEQMATAQQAAAKATSVAEADIALSTKLKGTDKETVMSKWDEMFDEYETKLADANRAATEEYYKTESALLAELEATGAGPELIEKVRANQQAAWEKLLKDDFKQDVEIEVRYKEAQILTDFIKEYYGDISIAIGSFGYDMLLAGMGTENPLSEDSLEEFRSSIYTMMSDALGLGLDDQTLKNAGVNFEDLLDFDSMRDIAATFAAQYGNDTAKQVMEALGFKPDTVAKIFGEAFETGVEDAKESVEGQNGVELNVGLTEDVPEAMDAASETMTGAAETVADAMDGASEVMEDAAEEITDAVDDTQDLLGDVGADDSVPKNLLEARARWKKAHGHERITEEEGAGKAAADAVEEAVEEVADIVTSELPKGSIAESRARHKKNISENPDYGVQREEAVRQKKIEYTGEPLQLTEAERAAIEAEWDAYKLYEASGKKREPYGEEYDQAFDAAWEVFENKDVFNDLGKMMYNLYKYGGEEWQNSENLPRVWFGEEDVEEVASDTADALTEAAEAVEDVTETLDGRQIMEDYWDALRDYYNNPGSETGGAETEKWNQFMDYFGDDFAEVWGQKMDDLWKNGGAGQENLPDSWFNPDGTVVVDGNASGLAMNSTMANLGGTLNLSAANLEKLMQTLNGIMLNVEEYTRQTANKDTTVVISPSSAFGNVVATSGKQRDRVTG